MSVCDVFFMDVLQAVVHYTDLLKNSNTNVRHEACLALKSLKVSSVMNTGHHDEFVLNFYCL